MMEDYNCIRGFADPAQLNACKDQLQENQLGFKKLSGLLSLAGNEVRLTMIYLLVQEKELCPCDLSDILSMTKPAVSQHLRKLKEGGLIKARKKGQTIYYSLTQENLGILQLLFNHHHFQTQQMHTV